MRSLEPIRVSLSTGSAWCGCCITDKVTIFRRKKRISFDVCSSFAAWFRQKYAGLQPRLTRIWRDLESFSWMHYAAYDIGGETHALLVKLIVAADASTPLTAEHARRCLPPDLIEALVAEKLDTM